MFEEPRLQPVANSRTASSRKTLTEAFDRLFASLPKISPLPRLPGSMPASLKPPLLYPVNKAYLGFTGVERRRGSQVQDWLRKGGLMPPPSVCSICRKGPGAYHSENYFDMWSMCVVCRTCHTKVHTRHRSPAAWQGWVERHAQTGSEWFALTPLDPQADFAGYLRRRFGRDYGLVQTTVSSTPAWVADQFPNAGLLSLNFIGT